MSLPRPKCAPPVSDLEVSPWDVANKGSVPLDLSGVPDDSTAVGWGVWSDGVYVGALGGALEVLLDARARGLVSTRGSKGRDAL